MDSPPPTPQRSNKRASATLLSPRGQQQHVFLRRSNSTVYNAAKTMDRLRSSMLGESSLNTMTPPTSCSSMSLDDKVSTPSKSKKNGLMRALGQVPAIALIGLFHLMVGIPFGVSYFPIWWGSSSSTSGDTTIDDDELAAIAAEGGGDNQFPLPGKESLGIRMFLFATMIGQVVFTMTSGFKNPIGLQMVENVPFCHELAAIVISRQGFGIDALSTLMFMFGLASVLVGIVFFILGKFNLGRIVYFFPTHVLIGCIGGIGVFILKTGLEVTINDMFGFINLFEKWDLVGAVLIFEVILRLLEAFTKDADGRPLYSLLSPIYFCMITPIFYLVLLIFQIPYSVAQDGGYFFPPLDDDEGSSNDLTTSYSFMSVVYEDARQMGAMWNVVNFPTISWIAVWESIPTLVALIIFSLIHVPINIPAFAISSNTEADMNKELIAHGYSNIISGLFFGLQNYMAYTQSVVYHKSGGTGRASGIAVAIVLVILFVIGPSFASFIPRCMAGVLLFHVGLDLFLEGVWDSYGNYDSLEYAGIWLIVIVMTLYGMDAAMIAGVIAAVSTYAVQSITYLSPIRGSMSGVTLRSSHKTRSVDAETILKSSSMGRDRILIVQLQGHLFFGNVAHFVESLDEILNEKGDSIPLIFILDFSLVLGIDSSAAQAITKLKSNMQNKYKVRLCIFIAGSDEGFPCEFGLTEKLSNDKKIEQSNSEENGHNNNNHDDNEKNPNECTSLLMDAMEASSSIQGSILQKFLGSTVCVSLDAALEFAENALIAFEDITLLDDDITSGTPVSRMSFPSLPATGDFSLLEEKTMAIRCLSNLCPIPVERNDIEVLFSKFEREVYEQDDIIWKQDSPGDCAKLLLSGALIALIENEAGTMEPIHRGNMIGELGFIQGDPRMSTVTCASEEAIVYSLSRESFDELLQTSPHVARSMDLICIKYLANRVQHVSNRIFETRCLPI